MFQSTVSFYLSHHKPHFSGFRILLPSYFKSVAFSPFVSNSSFASCVYDADFDAPHIHNVGYIWWGSTKKGGGYFPPLLTVTSFAIFQEA